MTRAGARPQKWSARADRGGAFVGAKASQEIGRAKQAKQGSNHRQQGRTKKKRRGTNQRSNKQKSITSRQTSNRLEGELYAGDLGRCFVVGREFLGCFRNWLGSLGTQRRFSKNDCCFCRNLPVFLKNSSPKKKCLSKKKRCACVCF